MTTPRSRLTLAVAGVLLLALGAAFVAARQDRGPFAERAVARAGDVEVLAPRWADRASGPRGKVDLGDAALVVPVRGGSAVPRPRLVGACGCVFEPARVEWDADARRGFAAFPTFPRRDADLTLDLGDGATVRVPNPAPAGPAADPPAAPLPVETEEGGVRWVLLLAEDARYVLVRRVEDRPPPWPLPDSAFRDASGNRAPRAGEPPRVQHSLWLPFRGGYALCPHEPWWELAIGGLVTFRFRPPPAPVAAAAPAPAPR